MARGVVLVAKLVRKTSNCFVIPKHDREQNYVPACYIKTITVPFEIVNQEKKVSLSWSGLWSGLSGGSPALPDLLQHGATTPDR